jgi:hypothetical protein
VQPRPIVFNPEQRRRSPAIRGKYETAILRHQQQFDADRKKPLRMIFPDGHSAGAERPTRNPSTASSSR